MLGRTLHITTDTLTGRRKERTHLLIVLYRFILLLEIEEVLEFDEGLEKTMAVKAVPLPNSRRPGLTLSL